MASMLSQIPLIMSKSIFCCAFLDAPSWAPLRMTNHLVAHACVYPSAENLMCVLLCTAGPNEGHANNRGEGMEISQ